MSQGLRVGVTADWHGYIPPEIPDCDLLVVAGDIGLGERFSYAPEVLLTDWFDFLRNLKMPVVAVAGNHDFNTEILKHLPWIYLQDELVEVCGMRIWGSPWSNPFGHGWAFNNTEEDQAELFKKIPDDTDIIISHGPPFGSCDLAGWDRDEHVGSRALRDRMEQLPNLKLVACGHIHPQNGKDGIVVNGSLVNNRYEVSNKPHVVVLQHVTK